MKKIQVILLALVAVFAFSAVAASGASAHEWLLDGKPILTASLVHGTGTVVLKDAKGGIFGEAVAIECEGTGHGFVGPGALDELDEATATKCTTKAGICPSPLAVSTHTSWMSELIEESSELRDLLGPGNGGEPGWIVKCAGSVEDTCVGMTTTGVMNLSADVDLLFDSKTQKAGCTRGGANSGSVEGFILILQTGHSIQAD